MRNTNTWCYGCYVRYCIVDASHTRGVFYFLLLCGTSTLLVTWRSPNQIVFGVLVCRCISTSSLNISQCLQVWPINPIVCREPQQKPHLKTGFPLRCFQRLSLPYVANQ